MLIASPYEPPQTAEPVLTALLVAEPVYDEPVIAGPAIAGPAVAERAAGAGTPAVPLVLLTDGLWHIRRALISSFLSTIVHLGVLVALGNVFLRAPELPKQQPQLEFTIATIQAKIETPKIIAVNIKPIASVASKMKAAGSSSGSDGSGGGAGGGKVGGLQITPLKVNAVEKMATGGSGMGIERAYGESMLGEVGEWKDAKATFFGVEAKGRSFVFVVDTSGSMSTNDRYMRCRAELLRSIGALKPNQKYFVTFFNHTTFAMPERHLVEAKPEQITKTQEWCKLAIPAGGTEPWDGLAMALRMKPDAIYLLTDGDFDPAVYDKMALAQPKTKKIPVHTIGFESLNGGRLLEAIARLTGGNYLYVP
ncbi:MAG: hypothetical protein K8U03_07975 [Planctomycetia bacterium]|nr:hypothetical protein [Planctomycetia bacterium]